MPQKRSGKRFCPLGNRVCKTAMSRFDSDRRLCLFHAVSRMVTAFSGRQRVARLSAQDRPRPPEIGADCDKNATNGRVVPGDARNPSPDDRRCVREPIITSGITGTPPGTDPWCLTRRRLSAQVQGMWRGHRRLALIVAIAAVPVISACGSSGRNSTTVPATEGLSPERAVAVLCADGFRIRDSVFVSLPRPSPAAAPVYNASPAFHGLFPLPVSVTVGTTPPAGTKLARGSVVTLKTAGDLVVAGPRLVPSASCAAPPTTTKTS